MARRGKNEGSIYKRKNGSWRAQVSIDGKRLSHNGKTRSECNEWLRNTQNLIDGGMTYSKSEFTLGEFLKEWITVKKNSLRPKPARQYERILERDIIPNLGKTKLYKLNLRQINNLYVRFTNDGRGTRTIRLIHSVLHSALEHALRTGLITKNPSYGAILPRKKYREMKIFNEEQVSTFLIAANTSRFRLLYKLALATGMRQSELLGLKWEDIDWIKGTIKIQRQAQQVNGKGIVFLEPKTRAGIRKILLGKSILEELQRHKKEQDVFKKTQAANWQENNLVFSTSNGTPFSQKNLVRDYYKIREKSNLPKIRFHDLRHTAASLMINRGIPIVVVSKILGHSKPGVTLNIYAHCVSDLQYEAAKVMEEITTPIAFNIENFQFHSQKTDQKN